ncbi:MAG: hypothetical protein HY292_12325, partial [Planctomycetes bacterium]|nr:hypothetical protein [Planctomycetota bacterium]
MKSRLLHPCRSIAWIIGAIAVLASAPATAWAHSVVLRVVDQSGVDLPGATITVGSSTVATGGVLNLSDGSYSFGLTVAARLQRSETASVDASTSEIRFEWITQAAVIRIVDQNGVNLPGATFFVGLFGIPASVPNGSTLTFPIVDPIVYPTMSGDFA